MDSELNCSISSPNRCRPLLLPTLCMQGLIERLQQQAKFGAELERMDLARARVWGLPQDEYRMREVRACMRG